MRIRDWISDVCSSDLSNTYRSYRVWLRYAISISSMATQDRRVQPSRMKMTDTPSKKTEDYKDTVFPPVTAFPMKAGMAQKETALAQRPANIGIADRLRANRKGRERLILPPRPPPPNRATPM